MKKPSRALFLYSLAVLIAGLSFFFVAKAWSNKKDDARFIAKRDAKENISVPAYVGYYGPRALFLNSGLCLLLLAAGPWATRTMQRTKAEPHHPRDPKQKLAWAAVAVTMIGSAFWVAPRMNHSLWADEATTMRKFTVGEYNRTDEGKMELKTITPLYRQFALKTPNNHMLFSTFSGMVHKAFYKPSDDPQAPYFSEFLLRIPAFIAGMGALLAIWWLAAEMGLKQYAWLPVVLLALHPWHVQYTAEARGYSMIMALVPASFAAVLTALRTGKWRWWLLYSLMQVMMVDTWPLAVDVLLTSNAIVFGMIITTFWGTGDCLTQLGRWGIASLLAAMVAVQLLLPALPQIVQYMNEQPAFLNFHFLYLQDAFIMMLTGSRWENGDPNNPVLISWQALVANHPVLAGGFLLLLTVLMIIGFIRLWRTSTPVRWMACLFVIIPSFIIIHLYFRKSIFLPWYWVPAMPGSLILLTAGIISITQRLAASAGKIVIPAVLAIYAVGLLPQHFNLRAAPLQQNREAALLTRKVINPTHPEFGKDAITAYVAMFYKGYDSEAKPVGTQEEIQQLIAQAKQEKRPLYVNLSRPNVLSPDERKILEVLDDPNIFEKLPPLYGTDLESTRWVYRYKAQ